jgi:ATP-dependent Lon protease
LRRAESKNPVFMLDEVDKLAAGFQGDPAAALLEVLDPEQNHGFVDHYLDVPFDLSQVFFIATANILDAISGPLRDRMEVIELPGYTEDEQVAIAHRHLLPKQLAAHGLAAARLELPAESLRRLVRDYTREAEVQNLEREAPHRRGQGEGAHRPPRGSADGAAAGREREGPARRALGGARRPAVRLRHRGR